MSVKKDRVKNVVEEPTSVYACKKKSIKECNCKESAEYSDDEYITSDEFRQNGLEILNRICKEHGLL